MLVGHNAAPPAADCIANGKSVSPRRAYGEGMRPTWRTLAVAALRLAAATARAQSLVPASDEEVLERLPMAPLDPAAQRLRELRAELAAHPDDLEHASRLAWPCIDQGHGAVAP